MTIRLSTLALLLAAIIVGAALVVWQPWAGPRTAPLLVGSTTTTQDSGMLDHLEQAYERASGREVRMIVAGSGAALQLGRSGDVDVLLTHHPEAEEAFVAEGHGTSRTEVMSNQFLIVGPATTALDADPLVQSSGPSALQAIHSQRSEVPFISRADESGTHARELALWAMTSVAQEDLDGTWYVRTGSGMAATLRVAAQKEGFTIVDEPTWLRLRQQGLTGSLEIITRDPANLTNVYSVIPIDSDAHHAADEHGGAALAAWLVGSDVGQGQQTIAAFAIDGQHPFAAVAEGR